MRGFAKLERSILESCVADSDELLGLYTRLLLTANWKPRTFKGIRIEPGQMVLSDRSLRDRLYGGADEAPCINTVKKRLAMLASLGVIRVETIKRHRIVSIASSIGAEGASSFGAWPPVTPDSDAIDGAQLGANFGAERRRERKEKNGEDTSVNVELSGRFKDVFDGWNARAQVVGDPSRMPLVRSLSKDRQTKLKTRLSEQTFRENWRRAIAMLPIPAKRGFDWSPKFDWLIQNETNILKLVEGNYHSADPHARAGVDFDPEYGDYGKGF